MKSIRFWSNWTCWIQWFYSHCWAGSAQKRCAAESLPNFEAQGVLVSGWVHSSADSLGESPSAVDWIGFNGHNGMDLALWGLSLKGQGSVEGPSYYSTPEFPIPLLLSWNTRSFLLFLPLLYSSALNSPDPLSLPQSFSKYHQKFHTVFFLFCQLSTPFVLKHSYL